MAFFQTPLTFESFTNSVANTTFTTTQLNNELNTATIGDYVYLMRNLETVAVTPEYTPTIYKFDNAGNYTQIVVDLGITNFRGSHILNVSDVLWLFYKYSGQYYYVTYESNVWGTPILINTTIAGKTALNNLQIISSTILHMLIEVQTSVSSYLYYSSNMGVSWTLIPSSTGSSESTLAIRTDGTGYIIARRSSGTYYMHNNIAGIWSSGATLPSDVAPLKYPFFMVTSDNIIHLYTIRLPFGSQHRVMYKSILLNNTWTTAIEISKFADGTAAHGTTTVHSRLNIFKHRDNNFIYVSWINSRGLYCTELSGDLFFLGLTTTYQSSNNLPCWYGGSEINANNYIKTSSPVVLPDVADLKLKFFSNYNTKGITDKLTVQFSEINIPDSEDRYWRGGVGGFGDKQTHSITLKNTIPLTTTPLLNFNTKYVMQNTVEYGYVEIAKVIGSEITENYWNSGIGYDIANSITTINPISITSNPTLEYNMKYNIEVDYDYAYIEVSKDSGANWDILQTYTGELVSWTPQSINLSAYIGFNILLRIRYTADSSYTYEGFNIKNIIIKNDGIVAFNDTPDNSLWTNVGFSILESDLYTWDVLDTYTNSLNTWTPKSYDLSAYIGFNVLIRFRYYFDSYYEATHGFYIKNISIVDNSIEVFYDQPLLSSSYWDSIGFITSTLPTDYWSSSSVNLYGSSDGWVNINFSINTYRNKTVYIKISYVSDSGTISNGVYFSDIQILQLTTVLDTLTYADFIVSDMTYITDNIPNYKVTLLNAFIVALTGDEKVICGGGYTPVESNGISRDLFITSVPELRECDDVLIADADKGVILKGTNGVLYAICGLVIYLSQDGGETWTDIEFDTLFKIHMEGAIFSYSTIRDIYAHSIKGTIDSNNVLHLAVFIEATGFTINTLGYIAYDIDLGWHNKSSETGMGPILWNLPFPEAANNYVGDVSVIEDFLHINVMNGIVYILTETSDDDICSANHDVSGLSNQSILYYGDGVSPWAYILPGYSNDGFSIPYGSYNLPYALWTDLPSLISKFGCLYFLLLSNSMLNIQYYSEVSGLSAQIPMPLFEAGWTIHTTYGLFASNIDDNEVFVSCKIVKDSLWRETLVKFNRITETFTDMGTISDMDHPFERAYMFIDDNNVVHSLDNYLTPDANNPWNKSIHLSTSSDLGDVWIEDTKLYNFGDTSIKIYISNVYDYDSITGKYSIAFMYYWRGNLYFATLNAKGFSIIESGKSPMFYSDGTNWIRVRRLKNNNGSGFISPHNETDFKLNNLWRRITI